ncbi:MAG TPA: alginate export family protein [Leptospiraceae bacterium]|nr:alginate export family protein [Leptospiraceae bacterium]
MKIIYLFILLFSFSFSNLWSQTNTDSKDAKTIETKDTKEVETKDSKTTETKDLEKDKQRLQEIEANLKKQQQELEELKKQYGVKSESLNQNSEDNYVSPLKTKGLTGEYNRSMFLDPDVAKKFNKDQKPWLNDWVRVGAYVRPRYEDRYNLGFDKQNKGYISRAMQTTQLFFLMDPSPYFTMKITVQDARVLGGSTAAVPGDNRGPTFAGVGNTITPGQGQTIPIQTTIREAWFMAKKLPLDAKLQVGRQILVYGDQRLLGGANWTINGLSYDGARLMFDQDSFNIHFLAYKLGASQSGPNGVFTSGSSVSYTDPVSGKSSVITPAQPNQYLVGTYDTVKFKNLFLVDLYSLGILTQKTSSFNGAILTNPSLTIPATADSDLYNNSWSKQKNNLWTTGFRISNRTANGNLADESPWGGWDWTFEGAIQSGTTGARVNKNPSLNSAINSIYATTLGTTTPSYNWLAQNQKYAGRFFVFQTGYTFAKKFRIGGQYLFASGDSNRTDGSNATFQTLPNPRFGVIPYWNNVTGLSENIDAKNLISKTLNLSYKTDKWGTFMASYFWNDKDKTQDAWYAINGTANTGATTEFNNGQTTLAFAKSSRRLYDELDFTWMYNLNDHVSLWIGGGMLTAGKAIRNQKNAAYSYNTHTGSISQNNAVLLGQSGAASKANMFFFQLNAFF